MTNSQNRIAELLISRGNELLRQPYNKIEFTKNRDADNLLNDLERYPHAYVLACMMDLQIKAERAWLIPYRIAQEIHGFELSMLLKIDQEDLREMFNRMHLHRFNNKMAETFILALQQIHERYDDDASNIWKGKPGSATVVRRFLKFKGAGIKIATMAANILVREFKIPFADHLCIDISPDIHVKRVFKRLGFVSPGVSNEELVYSARELNPQYPGVFDLACWEIGRNWCKTKKPKCQECYLNKYCVQSFKSSDGQ